MNSTESVNYDEHRSELNHFIKLRRRGLSFQPLVEAQMEQNQQELKAKVSELTTQLFARQKEVDTAIGYLTQEVEAIDFTRAGRVQIKNLTEHTHILKNVQNDLGSQLTKVEPILQEQKDRKSELLVKLNNLKQALNHTQPHPLVSSVYGVGEKWSAYVSQQTNNK